MLHYFTEPDKDTLFNQLRGIEQEKYRVHVTGVIGVAEEYREDTWLTDLASQQDGKSVKMDGSSR